MKPVFNILLNNKLLLFLFFIFIAEHGQRMTKINYIQNRDCISKKRKKKKSGFCILIRGVNLKITLKTE